MKKYKLSKQEWEELSYIKNLLDSEDIECIQLGLGLLEKYPKNITDIWTVQSYYSGAFNQIFTLGYALNRVKIFNFKDYTVKVGIHMLYSILSSIILEQEYYLYEET